MGVQIESLGAPHMRVRNHRAQEPKGESAVRIQVPLAFPTSPPSQAHGRVQFQGDVTRCMAKKKNDTFVSYIGKKKCAYHPYSIEYENTYFDFFGPYKTELNCTGCNKQLEQRGSDELMYFRATFLIGTIITFWLLALFAVFLS